MSTASKATAPGFRTPRGPLTDSHKERLQQIREAAAELFLQQGYASTDLRQIASAVDIHVSSLYNYIRSKENLLYDIIIEGLVEISGRMDEALATGDDPVVQLRAALEAHILHHAERRSKAWTNHVEFRALSGEFYETVVEMRHQYEVRWIDLLQRGMAAGAFANESPKLVAYTLLAVGPSVSRWYDPNDEQSAESIAKSMANISLNGVLARPAAETP